MAGPSVSPEYHGLVSLLHPHFKPNAQDSEYRCYVLNKRGLGAVHRNIKILIGPYYSHNT